MEKSVIITVRGRVQGVFYRWSASRKAKDLSLRGFVRNENDGTVRIRVEGDAVAIAKFTEWCEEGSEHAEVSGLDVVETETEGFMGFRIE